VAHNIARTNGKDQIAYVGKAPWHKLGTFLGDELVKSRTMVKAAGLDYPIVLRPVHTRHKGRVVEIPGRQAVVRGDTGAVFTVVSDRWEPVQNVDAFRFFDRVVGKGKAVYETAGALGQGERIWILARLPGMSVVAGDEIEQHVLLSNGHDGMTAFTFQMSPIRVVCQNTLNIALSDVDQSRVYRRFHVAGVNRQLEPKDAADIIGLAKTFYSHLEEQGQALAERKMSVKSLEQFLADLFPLPALPAPKTVAALPAPRPEDYQVPAIITHRRELVRELIERGKGNDRKGVRGTAWAAFNGVVQFADYIQGKDDTRTKSLLFGTGHALKQRAWDRLTQV